MAATKTRKSYSKTPEQRQAESRAAHDRLAAQVEELTTSEGWKAYLKAATRFHNYSFNNVMMILSQYPDATQVAGFRKWQEMGRQVRKGEKSIKIFGFSRKVEEDEATGELRERVFYPLLSVFALEQTDVVDAEKWAAATNEADNPVKLLTGGDEQGIGDAVAAYLTGKGWDVAEERIVNGANGYADPKGKKVRVRDDVDPAQRAKTLIHECGHVVAGHTEDMAEYTLHRGRMECEAEGIAYVVGDALGLDTSGYSVGYLGHWSNGDMAVVRETAEAVLKAAKTILDGIAPDES